MLLFLLGFTVVIVVAVFDFVEPRLVCFFFVVVFLDDDDVDVDFTVFVFVIAADDDDDGVDVVVIQLFLLSIASFANPSAIVL